MELRALLNIDHKIRARMTGLSLKGRLVMIYAGLMSVGIAIAAVLSSLFIQASWQFVLSFLFAFMLVVLWVSFKIINFISAPLSRLTRFLDQVDVEHDLVSKLPEFKSEIPEISTALESFERLFQRLHSFQALNVKRLLLEKRRADTIAASISDGIFLLRGDEIIYANPIAEKILEMSPGSFSKTIPLTGDDGNLGSRGLSAVKKAVSRTLPVEFVLEVEQRKLYYLIQSFPISNDLIEQVDHSVGGSMDQVLDQFYATTLVLAQDVTLVRESQEAKSHFLATLSHEVKTPVTSLTMATRLLKKSVDQIPNPTHRSLIVTCAEDVDRLRILLEDLMTVSRFDTLTQRLEIQKIDLGKLLLHSVQSFQPQARERGVGLIQQVISHGKPIVVPMDASKVAWALSNLIINALRHTPREGRVEARVEAFDEWVEVKVRDSGPGIDRHRQDRIFDKFNPYYDLRVARSGSMGVGLAIAREMIVAHGGRIWVVSEPGHGAEFCFTLPLKRPNTTNALSEEIISSKPLEKVMERFNEKNRFSL